MTAYEERIEQHLREIGISASYAADRDLPLCTEPPDVVLVGLDIFGRAVGAHDSHSVDIIHPAITIDKTTDVPSADPGQSVTYSYKVTNTGDCTLFSISVDDDKLGHIDTIASLAAGQSATVSRTVVIAEDSPSDNLGTATGADELGKTVSANDTAHIDIVLAVELARTGFDATRWVTLGLGLIAFGLLLQGIPMAVRRRES